MRAENNDVVQVNEHASRRGRGKRAPSTDRNDEASDYNMTDDSDEDSVASSKTSQYNTESEDDAVDSKGGPGHGKSITKQANQRKPADQMANRDLKVKNMSANDQAAVKKNNATINKHIN